VFKSHFIPGLLFPNLRSPINLLPATGIAVTMRFWLIIHWVLITHSVNAALENSIYYFAGKNSTNGARLCEGVGFECTPPDICAVDSMTRKEYCCEPDSDESCIVSSSQCAGEGTKQPSSSQQACFSGVNQCCCLKVGEQCTQQWGMFLSITDCCAYTASE
jgi:hypothetical protein